MVNVLNKDQTIQLFSSIFYKTGSLDDELALMFDDAKCFSSCMAVLSYMIVVFFEQKRKKNIDILDILHQIYSFQERYWFDIQDVQVEFIDTMLRQSPQKLQIEDQIAYAYEGFYH